MQEPKFKVLQEVKVKHCGQAMMTLVIWEIVITICEAGTQIVYKGRLWSNAEFRKGDRACIKQADWIFKEGELEEIAD